MFRFVFLGLVLEFLVTSLRYLKMKKPDEKRRAHKTRCKCTLVVLIKSVPNFSARSQSFDPFSDQNIFVSREDECLIVCFSVESLCAVECEVICVHLAMR